MRQRVPAIVSDGFPVDRPRVRRAARWVAALCIVASSAGCILTQDIPVPALEIPQAYKAAKSTGLNAPPRLDWWRGFGSPELTALMEEAQSVNLDIAAAVARFREADAQARIAGAPLLPTLAASGPGNLFQESYSRVSGSSLNGLSTGGRETVNYNSGLSASYIL
ncbi:MAG: RND transporter, partial [Bradyrhizobium sp.]